MEETQISATPTDTDKPKVSKNADNNVGVDFQGSRKSLVAREKEMVRAAILCPLLPASTYLRTREARIAEFESLANAIPLTLVFTESVNVKLVKPATYVGGGVVESLAERIEEEGIELLLIDAQLSPIQQRNLETATGAKVLDRTALILEIFGARASTREGVLQVELAHLNYQKGRLVRSWTHLERQRGGGGFLGGPGETQIESDRRQIQNRISLLESRIDKVRRTRGLQRKPREEAPYPFVALVGYTNAGKSSLFNKLTGADVMAKDLLFATLDTTVRRAELPHGRPIMLSDTVGFVADLPTDLVAAFRATLEEVTQADIILHVRDVSNPDHVAQARDVLDVLSDLGVTGETAKIIEIWNKVDCIEPDADDDIASTVLKPADNVFAAVRSSALTGEGLNEVLANIEAALAVDSEAFRVNVPHVESDKLGWLYKHAEILERADPDESGTEFVVRVQTIDRTRFMQRYSDNLRELDQAS